MTFVYFAQNSRGLIKIGKTRDVRRRMAALFTSSGERMNVLGVMSQKVASEESLHSRFAEFRVSGEWFSQDEAILNFIKDNAEPYSVERHSKRAERGVPHDVVRARELIRKIIDPVIPGETISEQIARASALLPRWSKSRVKHIWYNDNDIRVDARDIAYLESVVAGSERNKDMSLARSLEIAINRIDHLERAVAMLERKLYGTSDCLRSNERIGQGLFKTSHMPPDPAEGATRGEGYRAVD